MQHTTSGAQARHRSQALRWLSQAGGPAAIALALLASMVFALPHADAQASPLFETEADPATWVVDGPAPTLGRNPSNEDVGWVDALVEVDGHLIVGGDFQGLQSSPAGPPTATPFLAAVDATTGAPVASFQAAPEVDAVVRSLVLSPDGARLYVGGDFGIVAIDPTTGALDPSFAATVDDGGDQGRVWDIAVDGSDVFVAGDFTSINGTDVFSLAKVNTQGVLDAGWDTDIKGGRSSDIAAPVQAIDLSPDASTLYVGGSYRKINGVNVPTFTNGDKTYRASFAAIDAATGASLPGTYLPTFSSLQKSLVVYDIESTANEVVIAWGGPNFLTFHTPTGANLAQYRGQGDFQALDIAGDTLFVGHHGEFMGTSAAPIPAEADVNGNSFKLHSIALDGTYPVEQSFRIRGSLGIWAIEASVDHLWAGGHINRAGTPLRDVEGLVRFDGTQSTALTVDTPGADGDVVGTDPTGVATLAGTASFPTGVDDVRVSVRDRESGLYLQADGTFGSFIRLNTSLTSPGSSDSGWTLDTQLPAVGAGHKGYAMKAQLIDSGSVLLEQRVNFQVQGITVDAPATNGEVLVPDVLGEVLLAGNASHGAGVDDVRVWIRDRDSGQYLQADGSFGSFTRLTADLADPGDPQSSWSIAVALPATPAGHPGYAMEAQLFDAGSLLHKQWRAFDVA